MKKPIYKVLYAQVLFAIACGVLLGYFEPKLGVDLKPLGDGFIKLVQKITGAMIIFTSLMKPSPNGFKSTPSLGSKYPSSTPHAMANSTCTYKIL